MKDTTMQHSALHMSRRALCAGLLAAPVVASVPVSAHFATTGSGSLFEAAFSEYRAARTEFMRDDLAEKASIAALHASDDAFRRMLETPSGSVGDLATKLEAYLDEYDGSTWAEERLALIAADARRLADREA